MLLAAIAIPYIAYLPRDGVGMLLAAGIIRWVLLAAGIIRWMLLAASSIRTSRMLLAAGFIRRMLLAAGFIRRMMLAAGFIRRMLLAAIFIPHSACIARDGVGVDLAAIGVHFIGGVVGAAVVIRHMSVVVVVERTEACDIDVNKPGVLLGPFDVSTLGVAAERALLLSAIIHPNTKILGALDCESLCGGTSFVVGNSQRNHHSSTGIKVLGVVVGIVVGANVCQSDERRTDLDNHVGILHPEFEQEVLDELFDLAIED